MKSTIIIVHTRNDNEKLKRLLDSVKDKNQDILIVDDSTSKRIIRKNINIVSSFKNITHMHNDAWEKFKQNNVLPHIKGKTYRKIINNIKLGQAGWNTFNTRNVGLIVSTICFRHCTHSLNLDDDMQFIGDLDIKGKRNLQGIRLIGCPDLSRLEWLQLYVRHIYRKTRARYNHNETYVDKLAKAQPFRQLKDMIQMYTDLFISENCSKKRLIKFPAREELSGGAYATCLKNNSVCCFPPWYDEDWHWFNAVRKVDSSKVKFLDSEVIHNSDKKKILDKGLLEFEEIGKILTAAYKGEDLKVIVNERRRILAHEIRLIDAVESRVNNEIESMQLKKIKKYIRNLDKFIESKDKRFYSKKIEKYDTQNLHWAEIIDTIESTRQRQRTLVLSPHCDDAVFSLGGSILAGHLKDITVCSMFTVSNYTIRGDGEISEITRMREAEDKRAMKKLGADYVRLGFRDASIREYQTEEAYLNPENKPKEETIWKEVASKVRRMVAEKKYDVIMVPLGLGNHIDHRIAAEIGKELLEEGRNVVFYEDTPYDNTEDEKAIKKHINSFSVRLNSRTVSLDNADEKMRLTKTYKTQVDDETARQIRKIFRLRGGERLWSTEEILKQV